MPWPCVQTLGWSDFRQAMLRLPPAALHGLIAVAVIGVVAQSAAMTFLLAPSLPEVAAAGPQAETASPAEHRRSRCEGCGIVEAIRAVDGVAGEQATYEFTVRMKDNSVRTSVSATADQWRVGDRIIVMGGSGKP